MISHSAWAIRQTQQTETNKEITYKQNRGQKNWGGGGREWTAEWKYDHKDDVMPCKQGPLTQTKSKPALFWMCLPCSGLDCCLPLPKHTGYSMVVCLENSLNPFVAEGRDASLQKTYSRILGTAGVTEEATSANKVNPKWWRGRA